MAKAKTFKCSVCGREHEALSKDEREGRLRRAAPVCKLGGKTLWTLITLSGVSKVEVGRDCYPKEEELSLRDRAAFAALTGMLADPLVAAAAKDTARDVGKDMLEVIAEATYEYADAMMKARKPKPKISKICDECKAPMEKINGEWWCRKCDKNVPAERDEGGKG